MPRIGIHCLICSRPSVKNLISFSWPWSDARKSARAPDPPSSADNRPPSPPAALVIEAIILPIFSSVLPRWSAPSMPSVIHLSRLPFSTDRVIQLSNRFVTAVNPSAIRGRKSLPSAVSVPKPWISGSIAALARFCASAVLPNSLSKIDCEEFRPPTRLSSLNVAFHAFEIPPRPFSKVGIDLSVSSVML
ncbi:Uncharacterised protein [Mycobacteroides abscessus]|nr:Uncharacterised protein [Mycobacteroides abscessus]